MSYDVHVAEIGSLVRARREPKHGARFLRYTIRNQQVTSHVLAQTTHIVAAPHGLAGVVTPMT